MRREHIVRSFGKELDLLKSTILEMAEKAEEQFNKALQALIKGDQNLANEVVKNDKKVNTLQSEVDNLAFNLLAKRQPMAVDLRNIISGLKIATALERIADNAARIANNAKELNRISIKKPIESIIRMIELARHMLMDVIHVYQDLDAKKATEVWHRDKEIDLIYTEILTCLRDYIAQDSLNVSAYMRLIFVARCCERVGDHIKNIAEDIYFIINGEIYTGIS